MVALNTVSHVVRTAMTVAEGANAPAFAQAIKMAGEFGYHAALGQDARPNLGRTACAMAKAGTISTAKVDADGNPDPKSERDGASWLFAAYEKVRASKGSHPIKGASLKVQESKLRTFVKMGMLDGIDGPGVLDRAKDLYDVNTCKPAYDAYVAVCRAQIDKAKDGDKTDLTDDEIMSAIGKSESEPKTIEQWLRSSLKSTTKTWEECPNNDVKVAIERVIHELEAAIKDAETAKV